MAKNQTQKPAEGAGTADSTQLGTSNSPSVGSSNLGASGSVPQNTNSGSAPTPATLTLTPAQLRAFINEEVDKRMGAKMEKPKRVTEHTAIVRLHEGQPVIWTGEFRERLVEGKKVAFFKILTLGSPEKIEVEYLQFLNEAPMETVRIVSQKATEDVKFVKTIKAHNPDPMNIKDWEANKVDLEVTTVTYQAEVEVTDGDRRGEKYSIPTTAFNL